MIRRKRFLVKTREYRLDESVKTLAGSHRGSAASSDKGALSLPMRCSVCQELLFVSGLLLLASTRAGEVRLSLSEGSAQGEPVIHMNVCGSLDLGPPLVDLGGDTSASSFEERSVDFIGITSKSDDEGILMQGGCQRSGSQYPCTEYSSHTFEIPSNTNAEVTVDMRDCDGVDFRLLTSVSPLLPWRRFGFDVSAQSPDKTKIEVPPIMDVNATSLLLEGSTTFHTLPATGSKPASLENLELAVGATCFLQWKTASGDWQRITMVVESSPTSCSGRSSTTFEGAPSDVSVPTISPPLTGPTSTLREFRLGEGCWCPRAGWFLCFLLAMSFAVTGICPVD